MCLSWMFGHVCVNGEQRHILFCFPLFLMTLCHPASTYCGVEQNEHHRRAHQTPEARRVFVGQNVVEATGEDSHLVNDQLL